MWFPLHAEFITVPSPSNRQKDRKGRVADQHFRTETRIVARDVNLQCVLLVVGTGHSDHDFSVTSWVDPVNAVSETAFKQIFIDSKPRLLRC